MSLIVIKYCDSELATIAKKKVSNLCPAQNELVVMNSNEWSMIKATHSHEVRTPRGTRCVTNDEKKNCIRPCAFGGLLLFFSVGKNNKVIASERTPTAN